MNNDRNNDDDDDGWPCFGLWRSVCNDPLQHLPADRIAKRVGKGAVILVKDANFTLHSEWELAILLHGTCTGLPQDIPLEGPRIISNQIRTLKFDRSHEEGSTVKVRSPTQLNFISWHTRFNQLNSKFHYTIREDIPNINHSINQSINGVNTCEINKWKTYSFWGCF